VNEASACVQLRSAFVVVGDILTIFGFSIYKLGSIVHSQNLMCLLRPVHLKEFIPYFCLRVHRLEL
jgi:hypothetical protein